MKPELILAGIDGGSTSTRLLISDASGRILGRATGGSSNYGLVPHDQLLANFDRIVATAAQEAGIDTIHSLYIGSAGISSEADFAALESVLRRISTARIERIKADNDIMVGLAGGVGGTVGIALIAGTGSACFGRSPSGETWQAGGWEYLVDDRGSGYRIALEGLIAAVRAADGRGPATGLSAIFFETLGISSLSEIIARLHHPESKPTVNKTYLASLAPRVFACAEAGDAVASAVIEREIGELVTQIETVARKLRWADGSIPLVLIGSVANSPRVSAELKSQLALRRPAIRIVESILSPTGGALLLAAELAGLVPDAQFVENVRRGETIR